jgi:hypothetical protein
MGIVALGATVSLTALAGCSATATSTAAKTAGGVAGAGSIALSPLAAVQAAFTQVSNDNSVKVTGTSTTAGTTVQMSGDMQFAPLKMSMTISTSGGATGALNMSEIFDGTNIYLQDPQFASLDGGKQWAEINFSALGPMGGSLTSMFDSMKNDSPTSQLEPLLASGDLKSLGTETVDGQQATHYSGTLTGAQVAAMTPSQNVTAAQVQQIKQLIQAGGITSETIDIWIGSNNLPVQEKVAVTSAAGTTDSTMDFSDWGSAGSITDPPASEIGTLTIPKS